MRKLATAAALAAAIILTIGAEALGDEARLTDRLRVEPAPTNAEIRARRERLARERGSRTDRLIEGLTAERPAPAPLYNFDPAVGRAVFTKMGQPPAPPPAAVGAAYKRYCLDNPTRCGRGYAEDRHDFLMDRHRNRFEERRRAIERGLAPRRR